MRILLPTNFAYLKEHDEQLLRLGMLAERYFADDPNTCLLKLHQFAELLAQLLASRVGLSPEESQYELLMRLQDQGILPREIFQLFGELRRKGNDASHAVQESHATALGCLKIARQLGLWFHRAFKDPVFKSDPFIPPVAPKDESEELRAELDRLTKELERYHAERHETSERLETAEAKLKEAADEQTFWEQIAVEAEQEKAELEKRLAAHQSLAVAQSKDLLAHLVTSANTAALSLQLDEADTRKLIDEQLKQAGWEADSIIRRALDRKGADASP